MLLTKFSEIVPLPEDIKNTYDSIKVYFDMSLNYFLGFIPDFIPEPCICKPTTTVFTTTKQPDDIFLALDKRVVFMLANLLKGKRMEELVDYASNETVSLFIRVKLMFFF